MRRETERKCDKQSIANMRGPRLTMLGFVTTDRDGGRQIRRPQDSWQLSQMTNQSLSAALSAFSKSLGLQVCPTSSRPR